MIKKLQKILYQMSEIIETLLAVIVGAAVIITVVRIVPGIADVWHGSSDLNVYLGQIFTIVIAVEFLKMLCRPTFETVTEVLIFLVARHMIITETTPLEDMLSVISIILLLFAQRFIQNGFSLKKKTDTEKTGDKT